VTFCGIGGATVAEKIGSDERCQFLHVNVQGQFYSATRSPEVCYCGGKTNEIFKIIKNLIIILIIIFK